MRITKLFSSVLAALALMYSSGCSNTCSQQVAGYNVYGYPYSTASAAGLQTVAYNAAYNPGANIAPPPAAVYNYPARAPQARVKRTKVRYARATKQRFTQVNPYGYGQQLSMAAMNQPVAPQMITTNFGQQLPGTASLLSDPNFVPTVTTNNTGLLGYTTYPSGVTYAPSGNGMAAPVQPAYDYSIPAGSNVDCQTVYRRGRPIRQRFRKVRWVPVGQPQQVLPPAPIYQAPMPEPVIQYVPPPAPIVEPYTPPPVVEPYIPPAEPIPAPVTQVIRQEISPVINPVIEPVIEPRIQPVIEPQIKPVIEPTIRTRIEPTPVVEQPIQQPIVQPVVIQPIIQPVIQAPMQSFVAPEPVQLPPPPVIQQPVYSAPPAPVFTPPPAPAYVPPPMPQPLPSGFESGVLGSAYCPPDICPAPNPVVCQPGQNLSECFTLNDYQIQNSPTQIYIPNAMGPLAISAYNADGTAGYSAAATVQATPMGQTTMGKYEALPMPSNPSGPADFGMPQMTVPMPLGQTDNIPPVPAASEIENALDAMLSRDQRAPNLK